MSISGSNIGEHVGLIFIDIHMLKKEYVRYLLRYNRRSQTAFSNAVSQYLLRYPFQTIAGDQTAHDSMMPAFNAVAEPMFAMAVGTDELFCLILPSHRGELAVPFHYTGQRIMQEHDEATVYFSPEPLYFN